MKTRWSYDSESRLCWQGQALVESLDLKSYSSAFYVYDLEYIAARAKAFVQHAPKSSKAFYALKANSHPEILKILRHNSFGLDVVSRGEIEKGLQAGFNGEEMIYSGVGKTRDEITFAIQKKIHQFNVESLPELSRLAEIAQKLGSTVSIALRVNPEVEVDTHPYIATGLRENKFGIEVRDLPDAVKILRASPHLQFVGLSMHIGSQLFDLKAIEDSVTKIIEVQTNLESLGFPAQRIDIGGGLGIHYDQDCEAEEHSLLLQYMKMVVSLSFGRFRRPTKTR